MFFKGRTEDRQILSAVEPTLDRDQTKAVYEIKVYYRYIAEVK